MITPVMVPSWNTCNTCHLKRKFFFCCSRCNSQFKLQLYIWFIYFTEVKHLEEHFDSQRSSFEDEIACLKERVKHLEEVDGRSKENGSNNDCEETTENPLL